MDDNDIEALKNADIDYADIDERFEGNFALYRKLAELFLDDPHMANVEAAFAEGSLDEAEREVHALKGVAGNLSLTRVHRLAAAMNDALKAHNEQAAAALLPQLDEAYAQATEALKRVLRR